MYSPKPHTHFQNAYICVQNEHYTKPLTYYVGIMLNAHWLAINSKLCRHNWLKPTIRTAFEILIYHLMR